jgi:hypothetical protein
VRLLAVDSMGAKDLECRVGGQGGGGSSSLFEGSNVWSGRDFMASDGLSTIFPKREGPLSPQAIVRNEIEDGNTRGCLDGALDAGRGVPSVNASVCECRHCGTACTPPTPRPVPCVLPQRVTLRRRHCCPHWVKRRPDLACQAVVFTGQEQMHKMTRLATGGARH